MLAVVLRSRVKDKGRAPSMPSWAFEKAAYEAGVDLVAEDFTHIRSVGSG